MMDILYVVGTGSRWDNNELRYSLRSIAKNGRNVGRVFLVGTRPEFVSDEVIFIPCDDIYPRKHKNILHKVLHAIGHSDISSHFLISSDDHFYIKETDFDNLPVYYRNEEIIREAPRRETNGYVLSLVETRKLLERSGLSVYQTNPHCNTHFDVDVYRENKGIFRESFALKYGGELNCIMGNLLIRDGVVPEKFNDCKLESSITEQEFAERVGDANCISGTSDIKNSYVARYLAASFPEKCKYEK